MSIKIPNPVLTKLEELQTLVDKYPLKIPVNEAAKFLGMDADCLRRAADQGKLPFAIGCNNGKYGNRYTHIPTPTLYFWYVAPLVRDVV